MNQQTPILLSDEQVQRYIADGYILVDSNLAPSFHVGVTEQVAYALENELPHPGDNIVPRVPALAELCEAPGVRGALMSLLGSQFAFAPHRFPHNNEPLGEDEATEFAPFENQPKMAKGSINASGWHQDGHASCGRSRWHTLRAANVFYFPHDTPLNMGPTRFLAGSHLYAALHGICAEQVVMQMIPAGSVVIADFDLGHAGTPNNSNNGRYMVKFVALRTQHPTTPTWDHQDPKWHTPADLKTPHELPVVWTSLWNWLRGADRGEGITAPDVQDLPRLMAGMRSASQQERLSSLYDVAAIGAPAVDGLIDALLQTAGQDRHMSPEPTNRAYSGRSKNHLDRSFGDGQFAPEDAAIALGAIGARAVPRLVELLHHEDPWIRINAVYALGDAGPKAVGAHIDDVGALLNDPESCVIRVALDALCALGTFGPATVKQLHRFLAESPSSDRSAEGEPRLAMLNQIRYLSSLALLAWVTNADTPSAEVEAALIDTLDDENGYPPAVACLALERLGSVDAMRAAIRYLRAQRWDTSQNTRPALSGAWTKAHRAATLARLTASTSRTRGAPMTTEELKANRGYAFSANSTLDSVVSGCVDSLSRFGFCVVDNVIPRDRVDTLRDEAEQAEINVDRNIQAIHAALAKGASINELPGTDGIELRDVRRVGYPPRVVNDIVWLPEYAQYLAHPTITAIARAVLDDHLKIAQLHLRPIAADSEDGTPGGFGRPEYRGRPDTREWHTDWPHDLSAYGAGNPQTNAGCIRQPFPDVTMCLAMIWYLTDVDENSGATFIVPGSHKDPRNPRGPSDGISVTSPIPGDMQVTAKAGSVFIQDTRCWHASPMHNTSGKRVAVVNRWCPWWLSVDDYAPSNLFSTVCRPLSQAEYDLLPGELQPLMRHLCPTEKDTLQQPVLDRAQAAHEQNRWGFRLLKEHPEKVADANSHIHVDIEP